MLKHRKNDVLLFFSLWLALAQCTHYYHFNDTRALKPRAFGRRSDTLPLKFDLDDPKIYEKNITFVTYSEFNGKLSKIFYQPVSLHEPNSLFIGGENMLYKLSYNPNHKKVFSLKQNISIGPVPEITCKTEGEEIRSEYKTTNTVTNIFSDESGVLIWVCGTGLNGVCYFVKKENITQYGQFGSACDAMNLVGSKGSSQVLPRVIDQKIVYYIGMEYDDRDKKLFPPFLSVRQPWEKNFVLAALDQSINQKIGQIKLNEDTLGHLLIKFLTSFAHGDYIYFLTIQSTSNHSKGTETKLARVCASDLRLVSWVQIPLECKRNEEIFWIATAASVERKITKNGNIFVEEEEENISSRKLYVSFVDSVSMANVICDYDLQETERIFDHTSKSCNEDNQTPHKLMEAINGQKKSCMYLEKANNSLCQPTVNHYIDGQVPFSRDSKVTFLNDKITSLSSVNINNPKLSNFAHRERIHLLVGTKKSRIMEFEIDKAGTGEMKAIYINQLEKNVSAILPDPVLNASTATYLLLSEHSILQIPLESCSIYTSCTSCLNSQADCAWSKGECTSKGSFSEGITCPPEVYYYFPKQGPIQGGTKITFIGTNFGDKSLTFSSTNNLLNITVGEETCTVLQRKNDRITCKLPERSNRLNYDNNNGFIKLKALDTTFDSRMNRKYSIQGTIDIDDKFTFLMPSIRGVYPGFGPYLGGTEVLVHGFNLSIGHEHKIFFGNVECHVTEICKHYLVCTTAAGTIFSTFKTEKEIKLQIDGFTEVLNSSGGTPWPVKFFSKDENSKCVDRFAPPDIESNSPFVETFIFNESFQFRPNPVIQVDEFRILFLGHKIEIHGENFASVNRRPTFEIEYDKQRIIGLQICDQVNSSKLFTCSLPELKKWEGKDTRIIFRMDGYDKKSRLVVYNQPVFTADKAYEIKQEDKLLKITDIKNMHSDIPVSIVVNKTHDCRRKKVSDSEIVCLLNITNNELQSLVGSNLDVSVKVGNSTFNAGYAIVMPTEHKSATLPVVLASFMALLFVIAAIIFGNYLAKSKAQKSKLKEYGLIEMKFYDEIKQIFIDCFGNENFFQELYRDERLIQPEKVIDESTTGSGHYSTVYKGKFNNKDVAIKTIKFTTLINNSPQRKIYELKCFLKEAEYMKDFRHPNVISLVGVTMHSDLPAIMTPFMPNGTLSNRIKQEDVTITFGDVYNYALQIAKGMNYLADRNVVHRDLAARNVLIDAKNILKVADFGLTRNFKDDSNYYTQENLLDMPWAWQAIEAIKGTRFSTKSDVWSYGVLIWEILSRGQIPYKAEEITADTIGGYLKKGERLRKPFPTIPDEIFFFAAQCWHENPDDRPTFADIIHQIEEVFKNGTRDDDEYYSRNINKAFETNEYSGKNMSPQALPSLQQPQHSLPMDHEPSFPPRMPRMGVGIIASQNRFPSPTNGDPIGMINSYRNIGSQNSPNHLHNNGL